MWRAEENTDGDVEHIRYYVIVSEDDECKAGPPDGNDSGDLFAGRASKKACKTYQPICADTAEEDLMPLRSDYFFCGESNGLLGGGCIGEDAGVAYQKGHYEERASEVTDEGESPVL